MVRWLSIKEAAEVTGTSVSNIRRKLEHRWMDDVHEDRAYFKPSADEMKKLRRNKKPYKRLISEEILSREYDFSAKQGRDTPEPATPHGDTAQTSVDKKPSGEMVDLFRETLDILRAQLDRAHEDATKVREELDEEKEKRTAGQLALFQLQQRLLQIGGPKEADFIDAALGTAVDRSQPNEVHADIQQREIANDVKRSWLRRIMHWEIPLTKKPK